MFLKPDVTLTSAPRWRNTFEINFGSIKENQLRIHQADFLTVVNLLYCKQRQTEEGNNVLFVMPFVQEGRQSS